MIDEPILNEIFDSIFGTRPHRIVNHGEFTQFLEAIEQRGFGISNAIAFIRHNGDLYKFGCTSPSGNTYYPTPEGVVFDGLLKMCRQPGLLDNAIDWVLSDPRISNHVFFDYSLSHAIRCPVRRQDGSYRSLAELGLEKGGKKALEALIFSAIGHRDLDSIEYLRQSPVGARVMTSQYLEKILRKHSKLDDYENILDCFERYIPKVEPEEMGLQAYWDMLLEKKAFSHDVPMSIIQSLYRRNVVSKCPSGFVSNVLGLGRMNVQNANALIVLMQKDGIDCYPGYIQGLEGPLAAYDKASGTRDYQSMIDTCLQRKPIPGYAALLCGIPLDEVKKHKRQAEVLSLIHEMTGSKEALAAMDRKQRGRALMKDLGV